MSPPSAQQFAFPRKADSPPAATLHRELALFNQRRLRPSIGSDHWRADLAEEMQMRLLEGKFIEQECAAIQPRLDRLPTDPDAFMQWFEDLRYNGPGQGDALFPWLQEKAELEQMRWFLTQEVAGEAGFDDLVALTQVRFPVQPKLEMANNYWDEMAVATRTACMARCWNVPCACCA